MCVCMLTCACDMCFCARAECLHSEEPWPALKAETEEKRDGGGTLPDHDPEVRSLVATAMLSGRRADTHHTIVKLRAG